MNYFELFKQPFQYEVDLTLIEQTYRQLQREVHPDKYAVADEATRLLAVQRSAEVNDAYQTLKTPLMRAEYMLAQQGVDIRLEQQTLQDSEFLLQQMQWREQLETIADLIDPEAEIAELEQQIHGLEAELYGELAPILVSTCPATLDNAANIVRKLKFTAKLQDELARIEDALL